jgi:hypothetical protein
MESGVFRRALLYSLISSVQRVDLMVRSSRGAGLVSDLGRVLVVAGPGAVWPLVVVVIDVVDDEALDLLLVPDDGPVEQLMARRAGSSVRRKSWRPVFGSGS